MRLVEKQDAKQMMDKTKDYRLKVIIDGKKGVFEGYVPAMGTNEKVYSFELNGLLGAFSIYGHFAYNKNEDKLEIESSFRGFKEYTIADRFSIVGEPGSVGQMNRTSLIQLKRRVQLIAGFALSTIINGTKVAGFSNTQKATNRHFWLDGHLFYPYVESKHQPLFGTIEHDFEQIFKILWLSFPEDLTGQDNNIKKVTLEEGLLLHPFKFGYTTRTV